MTFPPRERSRFRGDPEDPGAALTQKHLEVLP